MPPVFYFLAPEKHGKGRNISAFQEPGLLFVLSFGMLIYMHSTAIITIPRKAAQKIAATDDLVLLPRREYERLVQKQKQPKATFLGYEEAAWQGKKHKVPSYQLYGKAAEQLDSEVREGLAEYRAGETKKIKSLADLD